MVDALYNKIAPQKVSLGIRRQEGASRIENSQLCFNKTILNGVIFRIQFE